MKLLSYPWFKSWGWIYRPTSWQGWVITVLAAAFCVHVLIAVMFLSPSASDTFYATFPYFAPTFLLWVWIGSRTSGNGK